MVLHRLVPVAAGCEYVEFDLRLGASSRCLGTGSGGTGGSRARATAARKQQHRDEPTPKRVVCRCLGGLQTEKWEVPDSRASGPVVGHRNVACS